MYTQCVCGAASECLEHCILGRLVYQQADRVQPAYAR